MTYLRNNTSEKAGVRHLDTPAPTIYFGARLNTAAFVARPTDRPKDGQQLTVQQAGILQSFRPDYPWTGTRSQQYQQVGNAIPPVLAAAVLRGIINL